MQYKVFTVINKDIEKKTYWFAAHGRIILVFQDPCDVVFELCFFFLPPRLVLEKIQGHAEPIADL